MKRAGNNIIELGDKRRREAYQYYLYAGSITAVVLGFILFAGVNFYSFLIIALLGIPAGYFVYLGNGKLKRASHAYTGASAEVEIALLLDKELKPLGWRIEYNFNFPRYGDIDVVLLSPKSHVYVIDVKSHKGTKQFINGQLLRRYGKNVYPFKEGDLLEKVRCQADYVSKLMHVKCTPILCFTQSDVDIEGNIANGVYILTKYNLVNALRKLG